MDKIPNKISIPDAILFVVICYAALQIIKPVFTIFGDIIMLILTIIGLVIGLLFGGVILGRFITWLIAIVNNKLKNEPETNPNN